MNILILDDDELSAKSLKHTLNKIGSHYIHILQDPNDFQFQLSIKHFDLCIVDILLPGSLNGMEVLSKASINHDRTKVWIVSGVLTKDNLPQKGKVSFDHFFRKPFNESEILKVFREMEQNEDKSSGIFSTFYNSSFAEPNLDQLAKEKIDILDHQLAILYCLCSLSKLNGDLILKNKKNEKTTLSFREGELMRIQSAHKKSYLGVLLASHGFALARDIRAILGKKSQTSELTGQKLVRSGIISPHALLLILKEQAKIRMSELIQNYSVYSMEIKKINYDSQIETFSLSEIRLMLGEIICSKIQPQWVDSFFDWNSQNILCTVDGQSFEKDDNIPLIKNSHKIFLMIDGTLSINSVINLVKEKLKLSRSDTLFSLYYLLVSKYIYLQKGSEKSLNLNSLKNKLDKFLKNSKRLNYYELLNLHLNATEKEIQNRINDAVKFFHPDKYQKDGDSDSILKAQQAIIFLNKMRAVLMKENEREKYLNEIKMGSQEDILHMAQELGNAQRFLDSRKYPEALAILDKIIDKRGVPSRTPMYYCWAYLKTHPFPNINEVENLLRKLDRVSIEEKHSYLYHYCRGLVHLGQDNPLLARQSFRKSININSEFKPSRIDMLELENTLKKKNFIKQLFNK